MKHGNLEPICAGCGHKIGELGTGDKNKNKNKAFGLADCDNLVTRALAVLAENGLYSMSLYLLSHNKFPGQGRKILCTHLHHLYRDTGIVDAKSSWQDQGQALREICRISENLHRLVLARQVTEAALVFARYHVKALKKKDGGA